MSYTRNISSAATQKKVLILNIPVTEDMRKIEDFTHQTSHPHQRVTFQIADFIKVNARDFGLLCFKTELQGWLKELVANSYDAYAVCGLKAGSNLELKIVIERNESTTIVKFKDNGSGFVDYPKSKFLAPESLRFSRSFKPKGSLGGEGIGLNAYIRAVQKSGGSVKIKNRKEQGSTIYSIFSHPSETALYPSTPLKEINEQTTKDFSNEESASIKKAAPF